ncbi:MAG: rubrerythrin family protein [Oscillospiraceae bacterium]|jgi:bacterioferritin|nr:rubrerythrin family protein [Oscillospiraceae bacterium]
MVEYHVDLPYPELNLSRNAAWAGAMLDNFAGGISEMSAVVAYIYRNLTQGGEENELGNAMLNIGKCEMEHLERFGDAARQLGADPRCWAPQCAGFAYWSPCPLNYAKNPADAVVASIREERKTIEKYTGQLHAIPDKGLQMLLSRIILDEELHVRVLEDLLTRIK